MTQSNNVSLDGNTCYQRIFNDLHFNADLMELDRYDMKSGDLSGCLDPIYGHFKTIDEVPLLELGDCSFDKDMFKDCEEVIKNGEESAQDFSTQFNTFSKSASPSPPPQKLRKLSPERSSCCQLLHETQADYPQQPYLNHTPIMSSPAGNVAYTTSLHNLTSSIKRSEMSRARVLEYLTSLSNLHRQPSPSSMNRLTDLLSGKRTALTAGLEESRSQLRKYMSLVDKNQLL